MANDNVQVMLDIVLQLEEMRHRAMLNRDIPLLRELFSDYLVYTHSSGNVHDKEGYLRALSFGEFIYRSIDIRERTCHVAKDAILIYGYSTHEVIFPSGPKTLISRFMSVWMRDVEKWRHVAWQSTPTSKSGATSDGQ